MTVEHWSEAPWYGIGLLFAPCTRFAQTLHAGAMHSAYLGRIPAPECHMSALRFIPLFAVLGFILPLCAGASAPPPAQPGDINCDHCAEWNQPEPPFRIYGNTYYVGVKGLASVLVVSSQGLVLLDGGLPQSAPLIESNIRALGFRVEDVRLILNSHAHFDHAGGIAALQRASGAPAYASPSGAQALRQGRYSADDPQAAWNTSGFPPVKQVRKVKDGQTLSLGGVAITARFTPGHTPGATSWTWRACEGKRCLNVVYGDSLNSLAAPGYRYLGDATHPDVSQRFLKSIDTMASLPCDILITVHPDASDMWQKVEARGKGQTPDPFIDSKACRSYADEARKVLDERLGKERAGVADAQP